MSTISGFSALRYDTAVAGELARLVAPPYDVIDEFERRRLREQSPYNIVNLTLADSPEQAGTLLGEWRSSGVLVEEEPALWWVAQDFVGPDGVARTREGIIGSVEATPYAQGKVLPHERTHAGPKEGRLRLLRATHTELEPIFLLYDAVPPTSRPAGEPAMDVTVGNERTRVWRLPQVEFDLDTELLIADGHHRYETAVAFRGEEPQATHTFAVFVSSRSPGLEIFPTHRMVERLGIEPVELMTSTWDTGSLAHYHRSNYFRVDSDDELDSREIESYEPQGVTTTASAQEAIDAVDAQLVEHAFLVRAPTVEQVFAFARRGEMMPQKTTYFFPKLTSGLLLFPV